jgi:hypothetical protein
MTKDTNVHEFQTSSSRQEASDMYGDHSSRRRLADATDLAGGGTMRGPLVETDRCRTPGPTPGVDLWWSGKHDNHGGNVQVIS